MAFEYKGEKRRGCSRESTPAAVAVDGACAELPELTEETAVLDETEAGGYSLLALCYPASPGERGWCGTAADMTRVGTEDQGRPKI